MKFVADSMLGKLAKRLRMLGFDVTYDPFADDRRLVEQARDEGRVLLTRDTQMLKRRDLPRHLFVLSDHVAEQLAQVVRELGITPDPQAALTRCIICNGELQAAARESVRDEVPPYVFQTQETFSRCPRCRRIYWRGTHVARMERKLADLVDR